MARMGRATGGAALTSTSLARLLAGPVDEAARGLLGCLVSAGGVTVRLTEVEAYDGVGADPASHAYRGRTPRNAVMFGPPGHAYVYFTYGMHWCLNVVCGPPGTAAAVLLRAGSIVDSLELARARRGSTVDQSLARGPACLTMALGIDRSADGTSLLDGSGPITLRRPARRLDGALVRAGPRVGVAGGHDVPWRFWIDGDPTVSTYRRHVPARLRRR
jgi:DNA-3-methyladenine glycosylase